MTSSLKVELAYSRHVPRVTVAPEIMPLGLQPAIGGPPGGKVLVYEISEIPEGTSPAAVIQALQQTVVWRTADYRIRFDELGTGRIVSGPYPPPRTV